MKICIACGIEKDESEFDLRTDTGRLRPQCKKCILDKKFENKMKSLPVAKEGYKICMGCHEEKPLSSFFASNSSRGGHRHKCKECMREKFITKYMKEGRKICRICGEDKDESEFRVRIDTGMLRNECKTCQSGIELARKLENIEIYKERNKKYREENREKIRASKKESYIKIRKETEEERKLRKIKLKEEREIARVANLENIKIKKREYARQNHKRAKADPDKKLKLNLRRLFLLKLEKQKVKKATSTFAYTEVTMQEYLENLKRDPLWSDYLNKSQEISIDHIIPCALFNFTDPEEIKKCWNPRNLRLLPAKENMTKNDKFIPELVTLYGIEDLLPAKLSSI